jgi:heme exporter protein D
MDLGPHAPFVIGAYTVTAIIVVAMLVWVIADHRAQQRLLRRLEERGVTRRSAARQDISP